MLLVDLSSEVLLSDFSFEVEPPPFLAFVDCLLDEGLTPLFEDLLSVSCEDSCEDILADSFAVFEEVLLFDESEEFSVDEFDDIEEELVVSVRSIDSDAARLEDAAAAAAKLLELPLCRANFGGFGVFSSALALGLLSSTANLLADRFLAAKPPFVAASAEPAAAATADGNKVKSGGVEVLALRTVTWRLEPLGCCRVDSSPVGLGT